MIKKVCLFEPHFYVDEPFYMDDDYDWVKGFADYDRKMIEVIDMEECDDDTIYEIGVNFQRFYYTGLSRADAEELCLSAAQLRQAQLIEEYDGDCQLDSLSYMTVIPHREVESYV